MRPKFTEYPSSSTSKSTDNKRTKRMPRNEKRRYTFTSRIMQVGFLERRYPTPSAAFL
jgi:hypothetical protein